MATPEFHLSARKPLHPRNTAAVNANFMVVLKEGSKTKQVNSKPKQQHSPDDVSNKENLNHHHSKTMYSTPPPTKKKNQKMEVEEALDLDCSLAEELSAMRKRMERLISDKEKTEKMLGERNAVLDSQIKDLEERGRFQKQLEMEVDRLFRLKELKSYSMRISPIKSLRERQVASMKKEVQLLGADWGEESMDDNTLQSPTPSDSSQFVGDNNDDDDFQTKVTSTV
ncbi:putative Transcript elongation factor IIS [Hibiscus syriacus]|uniref:Transcript elongation factor IIS n=1 Tax=Hibiscus syriacus TaxID=106335 RepID=A0A6A2ZWS8_HIBSY|nr:U-box domain-containing protein 34-like isoform X1 [Hibiscus syriacus]KAE8696278.1 putative Transcript elongation factor IIS [Hibiscus syriacus]